MNLDSYNQEIPYYSDIAMFGFMATTAVLASEGDYKQFDVGDESDAIIAYAKMSHLISM